MKARVWAERRNVWPGNQPTLLWRYLVPKPDGYTATGAATDWKTAMRRVGALLREKERA